MKKLLLPILLLGILCLPKLMSVPDVPYSAKPGRGPNPMVEAPNVLYCLKPRTDPVLMKLWTPKHPARKFRRLLPSGDYCEFAIWIIPASEYNWVPEYSI